jgi:spore coat polysaccharide biosynthesis predicted glycosyltransferase SpsG
MYKTLFFIDVDRGIGQGHLTRSLNLIKMIRSLSKFTLVGNKRFFSNINEEILNLNFKKIHKETKNKFSNYDLVIIDSYRYRKNLIILGKKYSDKILLIDDFIKNLYNANFIINQNPNIKKKDYIKYHQKKIFTGSNYTFVNHINSKNKKLNFKKIKFFINCGLYDQYRQLLKILFFLNKIRSNINFHCYIGLSKKSVSYKLIKNFTQKNDNFTIVNDHKDYQKKLRDSNISICSMGISVWERFQLGMPVFTFINDKNQKLVFERLEKNKNIYNFDYKKKYYKDSFLKEIKNIKKLHRMSLKNQALFKNNKRNIINLFRKIYST